MFSAGITNWMFVAVFLSCKILVAAELLEKYYDFSAVQGLQIFDVPANARREIEVTVTGASSGFGLCENSPMYKNGKRITAKINIPTSVEKLHLNVGMVQMSNLDCRGLQFFFFISFIYFNLLVYIFPLIIFSEKNHRDLEVEGDSSKISFSGNKGFDSPTLVILAPGGINNLPSNLTDPLDKGF